MSAGAKRHEVSRVASTCTDVQRYGYCQAVIGGRVLAYMLLRTRLALDSNRKFFYRKHIQSTEKETFNFYHILIRACVLRGIFPPVILQFIGYYIDILPISTEFYSVGLFNNMYDSGQRGTASARMMNWQ